MLTSLTYVETEQYLVVLFLVTAPRLIVRAGRGHRYAHAFVWKNKELSVCEQRKSSFKALLYWICRLAIGCSFAVWCRRDCMNWEGRPFFD